METDWFLKQVTEWMQTHTVTLDENELIRNTDAKGETNPFFGKKHTDEWKKAASERMKGNKHTAGYTYKREHVEKRAASRSRPVTLFGVTYKSGREAARLLNVSPSTIVQWKKNGQ